MNLLLFIFKTLALPPSPYFSRKVFKNLGLSLDFDCNCRAKVCQMTKPRRFPGLRSSYLFKCSESEVINRQLISLLVS